MEVITSLVTVAFVSLLAAVSPGPDFFVVVRNSLSHSRKIGLFTALGVSLSLLIHLSYTIIGIGILIVEDSTIYIVIKYVGAGYLFYLGCKGFISSFKAKNNADLYCEKKRSSLSPMNALKQGFLTNLLNPKCALFFVSFFSQFIGLDTPLSLKIGFAFVNWSITLGWFLLLSYLITGNLIMKRISSFRMVIDRTMGAALMLLGLKMMI